MGIIYNSFINSFHQVVIEVSSIWRWFKPIIITPEKYNSDSESTDNFLPSTIQTD